MSILVVGGDKLGNIIDNLKESGFQTVNHISGRKKGDLAIDISKNTDVVLILTDYVSHSMINVIKKKNKNCKLNVLYSKRSWLCIENKLKNFSTKL